MSEWFSVEVQQWVLHVRHSVLLMNRKYVGGRQPLYLPGIASKWVNKGWKEHFRLQLGG